MQCKKDIQQILDRLDSDYESPDRSQELWGECVNSLAALDSDCSSALVSAGRDILDNISQSQNRAEYKFEVILFSLMKRDDLHAVDLCTEALLSQDTTDKEMYVELLDDMGDAKAIPALMHVLEVGFYPYDDEGWVVSKAIDALCRMRATHAHSLITKYVGDPRYKVRFSAIDYLKTMNIIESASTLINELYKEDDEDNLELMIESLVSWQRTEALPALKSIQKEEWITDSEELQKIIQEAISDLESITGTELPPKKRTPN